MKKTAFLCGKDIDKQFQTSTLRTRNSFPYIFMLDEITIADGAEGAAEETPVEETKPEGEVETEVAAA